MHLQYIYISYITDSLANRQRSQPGMYSVITRIFAFKKYIYFILATGPAKIEHGSTNHASLQNIPCLNARTNLYMMKPINCKAIKGIGKYFMCLATCPVTLVHSYTIQNQVSLNAYLPSSINTQCYRGNLICRSQYMGLLMVTSCICTCTGIHGKGVCSHA